MRHLFILGALVSLNSFASTFEEVWNTIKVPDRNNQIYQRELPQRHHSKLEMLSSPVDIYEAARRILSDESDLYPENVKKLIRGNGVCLSGKWVITGETPYTGFFAKGSEGLVIARATVAFDKTKVGDYRSFGLSGKLFPTLDPRQDVKTANFLLIDDNAGTKREHFLDAPLMSEAELSPFNIIVSTVKDFSLDFIKMLLTVDKAQKAADEESKIRQLYPISRTGLNDSSQAKTPALLKLMASTEIPRVKHDDFRDELRIRNYQKLSFDIYVSPERKPQWSKKIGFVEFSEEVVSDACDMRLRFPHPKWDPKAK